MTRLHSRSPITILRLQHFGGRWIGRRAWPIPPFNLPFSVLSGTTRVRHGTMAEFTSARSGLANPTHFADGPLDRATSRLPVHAPYRTGRVSSSRCAGGDAGRAVAVI